MNEQKNRPQAQGPILVFDSGFGGISVLKKLVRQMPNEHFLYFGDSANAPYGTRSEAEVRRLTCAAIASQMDSQPKAIVIACNTATAAALDELRRLYPDIPVIGIRPAVADAACKSHKVLVLATQGTLNSAAFQQQLSQLPDTDAELIPVAAPGIVEYVEGNMQRRAWIVDYLKNLSSPYGQSSIDGVVLGCTHFPFAKDVIEESLGHPVAFFDASTAVAAQTEAELCKRGLRRETQEGGGVTIRNSACEETMLSFAWTLFASNC